MFYKVVIISLLQDLNSCFLSFLQRIGTFRMKRNSTILFYNLYFMKVKF